MQTKLDFFQPSVEIENAFEDFDPFITAKNILENFINTLGLVAYKDFYMKIKNDLTHIPEGLTKSQYLVIAREVYESKAAKVTRNKNRARYFSIRNKARQKQA